MLQPITSFIGTENTRSTHLPTLPGDKSEFLYEIYAVGGHPNALSVYFPIISNNNMADGHLLRQECHYYNCILGSEKILKNIQLSLR
jgi:hypothetical protein